jgi:hypothetical protein
VPSYAGASNRTGISSSIPEMLQAGPKRFYRLGFFLWANIQFAITLQTEPFQNVMHIAKSLLTYDRKTFDLWFMAALFSGNRP